MCITGLLGRAGRKAQYQWETSVMTSMQQARSSCRRTVIGDPFARSQNEPEGAHYFYATCENWV
eukprot:CAMPEP_0174731170 /NCGR_PEP_ID=MMETSP1094-20130205/57012_1 /TAXON_ID=156173 /ORGANISM="Chrysochromulina brevifilum, Strain UTEX LB 985" /LENGTH=63 /DNA_ID=CAMNT_0015933519 /DNA_START=493 /DNA_END=684 /DNA_ORIENTATION=+